MQAPLAFYPAGQESDGFETGIQKGLIAILSSTKFLYRAGPSEAPAQAKPGEAYALTDLELASRLAFFLWSSGPDEELLESAENNKLGDPQIYAEQVKRMFTDERSKALVTNFAFQWLSVRGLEAAEPRRAPLSEPSTKTCAKGSSKRWTCSWTASCATTART